MFGDVVVSNVVSFFCRFGASNLLCMVFVGPIGGVDARDAMRFRMIRICCCNDMFLFLTAFVVSLWYMLSMFAIFCEAMFGFSFFLCPSLLPLLVV